MVIDKEWWRKEVKTELQNRGPPSKEKEEGEIVLSSCRG